MSDDRFDSIVVGAGPAGVSAAIAMAKAGLKVVVLERGEYPGSKNVQGAIMYTKMIGDSVPAFWKDPQAPLERPITEQKFWLLSKDSFFQAGFKSEKWLAEPHNCYSVIRAPFDRWYAKKAEEAGAEIYTGITVSEVIKKDGQIVGVKTSEGDELLADVVIAADGVNSLLAEQAGLLDEWTPDEVALGVKEVLSLPREKLEDRFNLENGEGTTIEMFGDNTQGMMGYSFLYTNKDSVSFGVGAKLSHFQKTGIRPPDLLEYAKSHPMIRRLLKGAVSQEYSAHLIPEGGFYSMPPLYAGGFLIAGDAAQMVNPSHREGSNLAMTAGRLAGETVVEAKKKGDFSAVTLSTYQKKLEASYVIPDLMDVKDLEPLAEKHMDLIREIPELFSQVAQDYFNVDGRPKHEVMKSMLNRVLTHSGVQKTLKKEMTLKNQWILTKMALKFRFLLWKSMRGK